MPVTPEIRWRGLLKAWPLAAGVGAALLVGWVVFPRLLFSEKPQPLLFSHATHVRDQGMECSQCHRLREDGSFNGLPEVAACGECHAEVLGDHPEAARLTKEYVLPGKAIPWRVYQRQPDHVFFSHAAHSRDACNACHQFSEPEQCAHCHPDVAQSASPPVYRENRLTGYSAHTMSMAQCERCHAGEQHAGATRANNACHVCHK